MLNKQLLSAPENVSVPPDTDPEVLSEFIDSARSSLEQFEQGLLAWESGKTSESFVPTARRILHNMKGEAGFLGLTEISQLCHQVESLLHDEIDTSQADILFSAKDWLSRALQHLADSGMDCGEHSFNRQCIRILWSAEVALLDLGRGTSQVQSLHVLSCALEEIRAKASRHFRADVEALARDSLEMLKQTEHPAASDISEVDVDKIFERLDTIKQVLIAH